MDNDTRTISNEEKKILKVPTYTRKAIQRYQEKNKEKIREYNKNHAKERYENDEEFREYKRKKALERYYRNKEKNIV